MASEVRLSELIREDVIRIGLGASTRWEAIAELTDLLVAAGRIRPADRDEVVDAVCARERSLSTGLELGLAVPHGSVDCVSDIVAALGTTARGIPFRSQDGENVHLVVLLVIPKGSFPRHVRTLAGIATLARSEASRTAILAARTAREAAEVIARLDARSRDQT